MALSTLDEGARTGLTKTEVIELGQPHCDASFTVPPDPSKHYTAWNSMKTLMEKDLIYEHGRPTRKYLLTEDGWEIARGIRIGTSEKAAQVYIISLSI
jgi:crossover junction endonuclease MUS81